MQHRWRELFFKCLHVFVFGFSGAPNHDVFFVLCFVESFGRRWLYWFSGVQSDVGTSAASGLIFFAQKNTREDHLPTDGDRRTHKEKAQKKIDEKTKDFLNVGIGGADVHAKLSWFFEVVCNLVLTPLPVAQTGLGYYIPKTKWNYYINVAFAPLFLCTYMYLYIYIRCFFLFLENPFQQLTF